MHHEHCLRRALKGKGAFPGPVFTGVDAHATTTAECARNKRQDLAEPRMGRATELPWNCTPTCFRNKEKEPRLPRNCKRNKGKEPAFGGDCH